MNYKILSTRIIVLFITVLIINLTFSSCKKDKPDDNNNPTNSDKLILSDKEALPYQFITIRFNEGYNPSDPNLIYFTIGDSAVTAYRTSDKTIIAYDLQLPELAAGTYKIGVYLSDHTLAETEIKIKQHVLITDANQYIQDIYSKQLKDIDEVSVKYDEAVNSGTLKKSTADSLKDFIKKAHEKNQVVVNSLSDEEKRIYAYMIQANKFWLDEYKNSMDAIVFTQRGKKDFGPCDSYYIHEENSRNSGYEVDANYYKLQAQQCESHQEYLRIQAGNRFRDRINSAYEKAKEEKDNTSGKVKAGWAFVSTFVTEAGKGLIEEATGIKDLSDPFGVESIDNAYQKRSNLTFSEGEESNLNIAINLINASRDNADFSPEFEFMIDGIDDYIKTMQNIGQFLPYAPQADVPQSKSEKLNISGFTIDEISNPNISVQLIDGGNGKRVKFTANSITDAKTPFTFRVNVETKYGNASKTISAELQKISVKGKWNVEKRYYAEKGAPAEWIYGKGEYYNFEVVGKWQYVNPNDDKSNMNGTYVYDKTMNEISLTFSSGGTTTYKVDVLSADSLVIKWQEGTDLDEIYMKKAQ
ncbi:MAG: hypothetical protein ACXWDO_05870 [Bacteroidia bacterium]